ncbi:MAG: helix-turn-helix transcriptional regulator [Eubacteriales bacterium]|nr:helix-turn-helix transcriptional regulator [Eubacteriales bacterium]
MSDLGIIVKEYRSKYHLSMDDFAKRCPLSKGYISMIENGINPRNNKPIAPTIASMEKLAKGMDMELDALLRALNHKEAAPASVSTKQIAFPKTASVHSEVLSIYSKLSQENQKKLLTFAADLLSSQQMDEDILMAANDRGATFDEMQAADALMMDDSEWE